MKELIYLDKDFLHSFIAQTNDGLPLTTNNEYQEQRSETNQKTAGNNTRGFVELEANSGEFKIPGLLKTPSGKLVWRIAPNKNSSEMYSLNELEAGKEIISKHLHDNALNTFEKYLNIENKIKPINEASVGDYVNLKGSFRIIDLGYLTSLIGDEYFEISLKETRDLKDAEIEEVKANRDFNKGTKKHLIDKIEEKFKKIEDEFCKPLNYVNSILKYLKKISPVESFLIVQNAVIPLKQTHLRESAKELQFKYGTEEIHTNITTIGKITRVIDEAKLNTEFDQLDFNEQAPKDSFSSFQNLFTYCFNFIGLLPDQAVIMSPVAIYFE
ncbi:hypothetical protein [Bacillus sp. UNCCL81]|uniref:DUF6414 family protein n=1 Tax=Bacillus sp. UNCCL81 TaxID=1502755 RepID=UPI0008F2053C|nr:hypothetical protein [Bacillus sp. UNCCL81]SFC53061.1 hypothetical protein SAMN02799633_01112 [Bacillus sp. UNCCL81]